MDQNTLELQLYPLKKIISEKGDVYHAVKQSSEGFFSFGEAYFSSVHKGSIKGWKLHTRMTLNLVVPKGRIRFVVFDADKVRSSEIILGLDNYQRLSLPPNYWLAFQGLDEENLLLNVANIEHDPKEAIQLEIQEIPYSW